MSTSTQDSRTVIEGPGLLESLRQYWLLAASLVVFFAIAGVALAVSSPAPYSATARVGIVDPSTTGSPAGLGRYTATQAQFVKSDSVLAAAAKQLGESPTDLRSSIDATADLTSSIVYVTATSTDRVVAARRANAVLDAFTAGIASQAKAARDAEAAALADRRTQCARQLNSPASSAAAVAAASDCLKSITSRELDLEREAARFGTDGSGVEFSTRAVVPARSGLKAAAVQGVVGALAGFVIAIVACWILADRRRRIDDASQPGLLTGMRLLGEVPVLNGPAAQHLDDFTAMPAPAYDFTAVGVSAFVESGVVVVSGAERGAGSSTTAVNVAAAFAREGRRVVVVDCDNNARSISDLAGLSAAAGLSDVLTRRTPLEDSLRPVDLGDSMSLAILPAGRLEADMPSLLRAKTMDETLERLRELYDLVVVDTPPIAIEPDAASVARNVDGILAVVAEGTRSNRVLRLWERLDVLGVPVLGYVYNRDRTLDVAVTRLRSSARS